MSKRRRIYLSQNEQGVLYNVSSELGNLEVALVTTKQEEDGSITGYSQIATIDNKAPKKLLDELEAKIKQSKKEEEEGEA